MNWKNEVALITGASQGLGKALAESLARRGARVVLVGRRAGPLEAVAEEIRRRGGWAQAIPTDISQMNSIYPLVARAAASAGTITLLVNNASTLGPTPLRPWLETDCEDLSRVLETNVVGPFRLTKAILGSMLVREHGTIVNISSDAAREPYPNWGSYSVSKAALHHLTEIWKSELSPSPIRFLSLDPGEMDTQMHADALPDANPSELQDPADVAERLVSEIEAGR